MVPRQAGSGCGRSSPGRQRACAGACSSTSTRPSPGSRARPGFGTRFGIRFGPLPGTRFDTRSGTRFGTLAGTPFGIRFGPLPGTRFGPCACTCPIAARANARSACAPASDATPPRGRSARARASLSASGQCDGTRGRCRGTGRIARYASAVRPPLGGDLRQRRKPRDLATGQAADIARGLLPDRGAQSRRTFADPANRHQEQSVGHHRTSVLKTDPTKPSLRNRTP